MPEFLVYEPSLPAIDDDGSSLSQGEHELTIHFGFPELTDNAQIRRDVRWRMPWNDTEKGQHGAGDSDSSKTGARSMMEIAGGRLAQSGEGFDDTDFARKGLPDENGAPGDADWGL